MCGFAAKTVHAARSLAVLIIESFFTLPVGGRGKPVESSSEKAAAAAVLDVPVCPSVAGLHVHTQKRARHKGKLYRAARRVKATLLLFHYASLVP